MDGYSIVKLLHVLLFVYWLGTDLGVFYAAGYVRDPTVSREGRATALRIMAWLDQVPRYCLVLMLPLGYTLASEIGAVRISPAVFGLLWIVSFLWFANLAAIGRLQGTARGELLRRIDFAWRVVLVAGLLYDAWRGFAGAGHIAAGWVAAKLAVFALLILLGLLLRIVARPLGPALRRLLAQGSAPELEATISRAFARTRPLVVSIWVGLLAAAYIGIARPALGLPGP